MNNKNTGGPAFPNPEAGKEHFSAADAYMGMTLRDYFAAQAMQVELAQCKEFPDENWRHGIALDAYAMADAMLAAREAA